MYITPHPQNPPIYAHTHYIHYIALACPLKNKNKNPQLPYIVRLPLSAQTPAAMSSNRALTFGYFVYYLQNPINTTRIPSFAGYLLLSYHIISFPFFRTFTLTLFFSCCICTLLRYALHYITCTWHIHCIGRHFSVERLERKKPLSTMPAAAAAAFNSESMHAFSLLQPQQKFSCKRRKRVVKKEKFSSL
ncbi:hypothetical protein J3E68DRAFT_418462 [Trichoderma sp. SZMC 28012]